MSHIWIEYIERPHCCWLLGFSQHQVRPLTPSTNEVVDRSNQMDEQNCDSNQHRHRAQTTWVSAEASTAEAGRAYNLWLWWAMVICSIKTEGWLALPERGKKSVAKICQRLLWLHVDAASVWGLECRPVFSGLLFVVQLQRPQCRRQLTRSRKKEPVDCAMNLPPIIMSTVTTPM